MTDRIEALKKLKAKVEADPYRTGADTKMCMAAFPDGASQYGSPAGSACAAWNGSLDAARALHKAVLPGWCVADLSQNGRVAGHPWGIRLEKWDARVGRAIAVSDAGWGGDGTPDDNPARAWLLAILTALIAIEEQSQ